LDIPTSDFLHNHKLDLDEASSKLRETIISLVKEYFLIAHKKPEFVPGKSFIPYSGKVFDEKELQFLISSGLDFWLTTGRFNDKFQEKLAGYLNRNFLITTNSGSSANLLAVSSLTSDLFGERALKPKDEVITVAASFPTTVNPILQNNLVPVFLDIEIPTYNINVKLIESAITEKTKAIMIAHMLGNPFDLEKIKKIADDNQLWLIEDCCDALGATFKNQLVGTFGDISTFSFYPAHQITMGEGGAISTNNPKIKRSVESFRDWGRDCFCAPGVNNTCGKRFEWKLGDLPEGFDHKYIYSHLGYNLKLTDMQTAVGLAQLEKLETFVKARRENFLYLYEELSKFKEFLILPEATVDSNPSWFGFPITIKPESSFSREDLVFFLSQKNIDTRTIFSGNITRQPYFKDRKYRIFNELPNTDLMMNNTFMIGVFPGLSRIMLEYVVSQFTVFFKSLKQD
jgi:CDP-4-dehydro-6-deoxyglucose reductase, E1